MVKRCAICDQPITDRGRRYCADCRNWERDVNSKANSVGDIGCDHVLGLAVDKQVRMTIEVTLSLYEQAKLTALDSQYRYCPMCGECIRDEQGKLIVGQAWEDGEG